MMTDDLRIQLARRLIAQAHIWGGTYPDAARAPLTAAQAQEMLDRFEEVYRAIEQTRRGAEGKKLLAAGLTDGEAYCLQVSSMLATAFFRLPSLHPADHAEIAAKIHDIQFRIWARPAYRQYS